MKRHVLRMSRVALRFLLITGLLVVSAGSAVAQDAGSRDLVRLIVQTRGPLDQATAHELTRLGAQHIRPLEFTANTSVVVVPAAAEASVGNLPGVTAVERDALMYAFHHRSGHGGPGGTEPEPTPTPTPAPATEQVPWGVSHIQAPDAWSTSTGASANVCVADTGIDKTHPDLQANIVAGRNFAGSGPFNRNVNPDAWSDGNGHGTHVAGTVAALNNGAGVVGVAPNAGLLVAKVLSDNGSGYISSIVDGLNWCRMQGAHVVNMSFGSSAGSDTMHGALQQLAAANVVLVAASGNSGGAQPGFPAAYPEVIAVGATDSADAVASWSNRGEEVNAPGVAILSTVPTNSYATYSGTSMASPHAAGVAALIVSKGVASATLVRELLSSTADAIAGGIRINAYNAVQ